MPRVAMLRPTFKPIWIFGSACLWAVVLNTAWGNSAETRQFAKWSKIELTFKGPASRGLGQPNPFAVRMDATFTSPSGRQHLVPCFYDGDGSGGLDGNLWKVRFSADELGQWDFITSSKSDQLDNQRGIFTVTPVPDDAKGFWKWGRLESVGTHQNQIRYLKFRDGPFWLKAGCDDPENFLGNYRNYDTLEERKAAIDFLAQRGINSLYIMTHNVRGDDQDVWPWIGSNQQQAMSNGAGQVRFDVAKLDQWHQLFEYMQMRGVAPYLVLEDDSAWKGYDRNRYYREIIARFGYLPALLFNCGEEHNENYRLSEALQHMRYLQSIDPFDHPRGIHNVNQPHDAYVDADCVDFTSIQTGSPGSRRGLENALEHNRITIDWIERCRQRGRRVLVVNFDEARPEEDRRCWWSVYLGGGVWESHVTEPYDRPPSAWERTWVELGGARTFMQSLPFWKMEPHNELVTGKAFCLAKPGRAYALYLPTGGAVSINLPAGIYDVAWWNPANGVDGRFQNQRQVEGGTVTLSAPSDSDWAARIVRSNSE